MDNESAPGLADVLDICKESFVYIYLIKKIRKSQKKVPKIHFFVIFFKNFEIFFVFRRVPNTTIRAFWNFFGFFEEFFSKNEFRKFGYARIQALYVRWRSDVIIDSPKNAHIYMHISTLGTL